MADKAHRLTDKELSEMEKHLSEIYERANKELTEKADQYFNRFAELDEQKKKLVDEGKLSEEDYKLWRQNKIMTGKHWTQMKEQTAQELLQANRTAAEYINGKLPGVYATNYNLTGKGIAGAVNGYSFEAVDASTVKNLATSDKTLLPYKYVDGRKDERWNTQKVNAEVLQGIIQGDSIPNLSKRLRNVTEMNRASAIRNARTTVTSAENKGRMDSYHMAQEKGVRMVKVWMATVDERTREEHIELDGQERDIDEPFKNSLGEIMYPGDPDADPANVYNCRCTLITRILGFGEVEKEEEERQEEEPTAKAEDRIISIDACETFDDLEEYLNRTHGIQVSQSVRDLDFNGVKNAIAGAEYVMGSFPELEGQIQLFSTDRSGYMCSDGKTIYFNPAYFTPKKYDGDTTWSFSAGAHEAGHCIDRLLCERLSETSEHGYTGALFFINGDVSRSVVRQAVKEFKAENPSFAGFSSRDVRGLLSSYATKDTSETLAEAVRIFADRESGRTIIPEKFANNQAIVGREKFARKVVDILKERIIGE